MCSFILSFISLFSYLFLHLVFFSLSMEFSACPFLSRAHTHRFSPLSFCSFSSSLPSFFSLSNLLATYLISITFAHFLSPPFPFPSFLPPSSDISTFLSFIHASFHLFLRLCSPQMAVKMASFLCIIGRKLDFSLLRHYIRENKEVHVPKVSEEGMSVYRCW